MTDTLSPIIDAARFYSLSVVQSGSKWQANLQVERGAGFRVCHGATPAEAIAALFAPVPCDLAAWSHLPEPIPPLPTGGALLPPCPVPA